MTTAPVPLDRRQRRRLETIEEVLDVAAGVMAEQGVAALSIGEVARRMGIRPPSLYVYFDSKNALYDGLFARGARLVLEATEPVLARAAEQPSLEAALLEAGSSVAQWALANPAYSQLIFWRPVPGFEPSEEAYAPAVRMLEVGRDIFTRLQDRGLIRADAPVDAVLRDWTVVISGVVSQQLSNAPDEPFDRGRFTSALPELVAMFARYYAPDRSVPTKTTRRPHRADQR